MEQITLRIPADTLQSIDSGADEHGKSRSEHMRDILKSHTEHGDPAEHTQRIDELQAALDDKTARIDELQDTIDEKTARIDELQTDVERLQNQNQLILNQRDENRELVKYVQDERTVEQRWRQAGLGRRIKWRLFGMPDDDASDD